MPRAKSTSRGGYDEDGVARAGAKAPALSVSVTERFSVHDGRQQREKKKKI